MNKLKKSFCSLLFLIAIFIAMPAAVSAQVIEIEYDFRASLHGWTTGFADYNPSTGADFELDSGLRFMPRKVTHVPRRGLYIQGHNRSDDLFMFLKRRLAAAEGIVAGQTYQIEYVIKFASNAASGCAGIGGAPGESVAFKAGASPIEPLAIVNPGGFVTMNVDKGNQSTGGIAASVAGNIANGIPCTQAAPRFPFAMVQRVHQHTPNIAANAGGELWLLIGTDSGFEGLTRLYYQSIRVKLTPV